MGCLSSRQAKISAENQLLTSFEDSLEFRFVEVTDIEVNFTRLMKSSIPPLQGINRLVESLRLTVPKTFTDSLETQFQSMGENSYRNLCVFMVLIGDGSDTKKAETIWNLFDINMEDFLRKDDLKEMIQCLLLTSFKFTIHSAIKVINNPDKLIKWGQINQRKIPVIAEKATLQLIDEKESLAKKEFVEHAVRKKLLKLSDLRLLLDNDSISNLLANSLKLASLGQQPMERD